MAKKNAQNIDCPREMLKTLKPVKVKCPECGHNEFEPARGRFGVIWRCKNRPECKFWLNSMPIGKKCRYKTDGKMCGALMVEETIPNRCSNKECPNLNPHKLNK